MAWTPKHCCRHADYVHVQVGTLTPHTLQEQLKHHDHALLVMAYAGWSQSCAAFDATFAQLSLKYRSRQSLRFMKLDVSRRALLRTCEQPCLEQCSHVTRNAHLCCCAGGLRQLRSSRSAWSA